MTRRFTIIVFLPCFLFLSSNAQKKSTYDHLFLPKPSYTVYRTTGSIAVDGNLSEKAWNKVAWVDKFADITGSGPVPHYKTRYKMLWDDRYLYIAALLETPDVWSHIEQDDVAIFFDDAFEIFIDPDGDTQDYFEIEMNANNKIFDLFMTKPYRDGGTSIPTWDARGMLHEVKINGTLNDGRDTDESWAIEIAIPFQSLRTSKFSVPVDGTVWRLNFLRVVWEVAFDGRKYQKKKNVHTGKDLPSHHWTWSPQGMNNMHYPERWGYVRFSDNKGTEETHKLTILEMEKWKEWLWLVYHQQKDFFQRHKKYASSIDALPLAASKLAAIRSTGRLSLEATSKQFTCTFTPLSSGNSMQIDHEGKLVVIASKQN